jgi:hypothetical protein
MADVTFDGTARLIIINNGITEIDAADIYSWWKEWVLESDNAKYLEAFTTTGGDPISGTVNISAYFFLTNDWRIRSWEGDHTLTVNGNLYVEGGVGFPFVPTEDPWTVLVTLQVSPQSQTVSTGSGVTPGDVDDIAEAVWAEKVNEFQPATVGAGFQTLLYGEYIFVDGNSPFSGTGTFGLGTKAQPLNNINDAVTVANSRKIKKLMLLSSITVEAGDDISNKSVETIGTMGIDLTLAPDCTCNSAIFRYLNIEGTVSNGDIIQIENCSVMNLENFTGIMNNVSFGQGSEISIGIWATIIQATAGGDPTNEPEINIGNSFLNISHLTGNLKLTGKTGSNRTVINADSMNILIASSCVAGIIQLLGVGIIESDNSGAGCNVDSDGFISIQNITDHVWTEDLEPYETQDDTAGQDVKDIKRSTGLIPATL